MPDPGWPPIADLIPHAHDAILIDRILEHDTRRTTVAVRPATRPMLRRADESVPSWLAVEYMAQAIAAHEGMVAWTAGRRIPIGYLISATNVQLHVECFDSRTPLRVTSERVRGRPGLGALSHRCSILGLESSGDDATLAEGSLSIAVDPASRSEMLPEPACDAFD